MVRNFLAGRLAEKLTPEELRNLAKSVDCIGDVAVVKVPPELDYKKTIIAEAVLAVNRNIKTVLNQIGPVSGAYRVRNFEWIAGEKKTITTYREHGCSFKVDLSEVYFSPRLSFERLRITSLVRKGETVVNMFAGVGCFSIVIAKNCEVRKVYSIDINPSAFDFMKKNILLNKVDNKVEAILGDAKAIIEDRLPGVADRVLMPLPEKACEYLDAACLALKPTGGIIHYYDFVRAKNREDAMDRTVGKVEEKLTSLGKSFELVSSRMVRTVGPNRNQVVLDLRI